MKSVLISIRPKSCEKIANGDCNILIKKSAPKEVPFKCYIYMTQGAFKDLGSYSEWIYKNRMKVIGEFVCDSIEDFSKWEFDYSSLLRHINLYSGTNGDYKFLDNYLKGEKYGYGWHISDLKIYDKPLSLKELGVNRPPQSYMYVEEVE